MHQCWRQAVSVLTAAIRGGLYSLPPDLIFWSRLDMLRRSRRGRVGYVLLRRGGFRRSRYVVDGLVRLGAISHGLAVGAGNGPV